MALFSNFERIVLKVGSALIAPDGKGCSPHKLFPIAQFIIECRSRGIEVVLVSSGSIAAGRQYFPKSNCDSIAMKKAMAAAGQADMISTWDRLFDFPTCQILLTHGDLADPERYQSVSATIDKALSYGILPIVNENDTITTDELKVGDNDNLAAIVSAAVNADGLVLCTDVDGLYTGNPREDSNAKLIPLVKSITAIVKNLDMSTTNSVGTGGMATKVESAEKATAHGITTYIINGEKPDVFPALLRDENPGTIFEPSQTPMSDRTHWLKHTTRSQGEFVVDKSGEQTVLDGIGDLTSDQLLSVIGDFNTGDTVLIKSQDGKYLAKAITKRSSCLMSYVTELDDVESEQLTPLEAVFEHEQVSLLK
jgi:glutamate 5-kinase